MCIPIFYLSFPNSSKEKFHNTTQGHCVCVLCAITPWSVFFACYKYTVIYSHRRLEIVAASRCSPSSANICLAKSSSSIAILSPFAIHLCCPKGAP